MTTENPSGSGCLAMLFMMIVALFVGTRTLTTPLVSDVPPAPLEAVIYQFKSDSEVSVEDQQLTVDIINQRLTALGITPDVQLYPTTNDNPATIRVLLPGGDDFQSTLGVISQPGDFELVDLSGLNPTDYQDALIWTTHQAESGAERPSDAQQHPETNQPFTTILDSAQVEGAVAHLDTASQRWIVLVKFNDAGSAALAEYSAAHIGEALAIVVDARVLAVPVLQSMISGEAVIQGNFVESEAQMWVALIGFGALPVPLELVSIG